MESNSGPFQRYPPVQQSFVGKRRTFKDKVTRALPDFLPSGERHKGIFTGRAIEIEEPESVREIHENGCFGVGAVTKSTPQFLRNGQVDLKPERLLLFPEEAFFLSYSLKCLEILRPDGSQMSDEECLTEFSKIHPQFITSFVAYLYLRTKNWVLKSGIKFGGDFLAYRRGPEFFHASYLVLIRFEGQEPVNPVQLQSIHRVTQTSGKEVLFLEITPAVALDSLSDYLATQFTSFQVTEVIPTRFILK